MDRHVLKTRLFATLLVLTLLAGCARHGDRPAPAAQLPNSPGALTGTASTLQAESTESETRPEIVPILWMRLFGKSAIDPVTKEQILEPEIHVVASPPLPQDRVVTPPEKGRFISMGFEIENTKGEKTQAHFQFRHPTNGIIEPFHTEGSNSTLLASTGAQSKIDPANPKPFEMLIRIPIDSVTEDLLRTLADDYDDFAKREEAYGSEASEANFGKRESSRNRLDISKMAFKEKILHRAMDAWAEGFPIPVCKETDGDCLKKAEDLKQWIFDKRKTDEKKFFSYLDDISNVHRLKEEYHQTILSKASYSALVAKRPAGAPAPDLPAPPQLGSDPKDDFQALIRAAGAKLLRTDGKELAEGRSQPNRWKIVFLGDGFTGNSAADEEHFIAEAQAKWDFLFGNSQKGIPGTEPFRAYRSYFIGVAIYVPSANAGSCHIERFENCRDGHGRTFFESSFGNNRLKRLTTISDSGMSRAERLVRAKVPDFSLITVIINDREYGGGGGAYATASLNEMSNDILAHELMGHTMSHLGDEYDDEADYPGGEEPNTTKDPEGLKWSSFLKEYILENRSRMPVTPPESEWIDKPFEGAHYHKKGWYRPYFDCKMRTLAKKPIAFCPVCRETILTSIYTKTKPIDSTVPTGLQVDSKNTEINATIGQSWSLKVNTMKPELALDNQSVFPMKIQWFISPKGSKDEKSLKPIAGATRDALTNAELAQLEKGDYLLGLQVVDTNPAYVLKLADDGSLKKNPLAQLWTWKLKLRK